VPKVCVVHVVWTTPGPPMVDPPIVVPEATMLPALSRSETVSAFLYSAQMRTWVPALMLGPAGVAFIPTTLEV
jgi:hypothetical protein